MSKSIWELLWDNFIEKYVLFGKRWVLLVPILLVPALFGLTDQVFDPPDFQTAVTNIYFVSFSLAVVVTSFIYFVCVTNLPPPKDRFAIAVAKFHPIGEDAEKEAPKIRDRIREALDKRMAGDETRGLIKPLREVVDPRFEDGIGRAYQLMKHYRAHIVICGTVRLDEEYYFAPRIFSRAKTSYEFSPRGEEVPSPPKITIPEKRELLAFKEDKVSKVADLATFILGMAKIHNSQYAMAKKILDRIAEPSAEVLFYQGFALLADGDFEQALSYFEHAHDEKPDFAFAWLYAGIALSRLGKYDSARNCLEHASKAAEEASGDRVGKDAVVVQRAVLDVLNGLLRTLTDSQERIKRASNLIDEMQRQNLFEELFGLGLEAFQRGEYENAVEAFDLALRLYPDDVDTLAIRNRALAELGYPERE